MNTKLTFRAAVYARASKDDANGGTIESQIELCRGFVSSMPEIEIVSVREDNGFSGVDFNRPAFGEMIKDIAEGIINCVLVKDLSRLGRNYIEVGELLDVTFPRSNVRVIAVNDSYDSINPRGDYDDILLPIKNLINEQYLRDFSVKIRSSLEVKRKKGEFVASFAPYGYKRDETDKHKLVIDNYAADVVRRIFSLKIEGHSKLRIAELLNADGEPSPAEYKKRSTNYIGTFQTKAKAAWSNTAVGRILSNPVYTGVLVQGKATTPNYKVKKRVLKSEAEWSVVNKAHEPIISRRDFETVGILLGRDTRARKDTGLVYPLSGFMYCGDCGDSMVRSRTGKYVYYVCASSMKKGVCSSHCIQDRKIETAVFEVIRKQIAYAADIEKAMAGAKAPLRPYKEIAYLEGRVKEREREIGQYEAIKGSLYADYKRGVISEQDFISFNADYELTIKELKKAVAKLENELKMLCKNGYERKRRQERFELTALSRRAVVSFIERIEVFAGKRVLIVLRCQDAAEALKDVLGGALSEDGGGRD